MSKIVTNFIETLIKPWLYVFAEASEKNKRSDDLPNKPIVFEVKTLTIFIWAILLFGCMNRSYAQSLTLDSDGDGIPDLYDLDNDNDGILDNDECSPTPPVHLASWYNSGDFNPYYTIGFNIQNLYPSTSGNGVTRSIVGYPNNYQKISGVSSTTLSQAIAANDYVEYSFTTNNVFGVLTSVGNYSTNPQPGYPEIGTKYSYAAVISNDNFASYILLHDTRTYTPAVGNTTIVVDKNYDLHPNTTYKIRVYFYSVTGGATASFVHDDFTFSSYKDCDTDGDGIPNRFDLDSDNDGCVDALEGDENVTTAMLKPASATLSVGFGSSATNQNLGNVVDAQGVPIIVNSGGAADIGADQGQGVGSSQNPEINGCPIESQCITGDCNENAFLNTSNPNTIEYDNLISGFHSSIAKQKNGNYLIWGQGAKPNTFGENLYEPTEITPANGFNYTGKILKATLGTRGATNTGSDQYAILTTDGLYIWGGGDSTGGRNDGMVHRTVKGTQTFDKMTNTNITNAEPTTGLPIGVTPTDVKMMFGSYATLAIVTCTGDAYILSHAGNKNGDGTTDAATNQNKWHKVMIDATTPLNRVVAMRGIAGAMVALTYDGDLYTWGTDTYLGNGTAKVNRLYATKMTLPAGVIPKMIGMTKASASTSGVTLNSYYLLSTTGELYSLGDNSKKQLGTFDTVEKTSWVNVKSTDASTNMTNIAWISPNEHDAAGHAVVTALTTDGKLWGWGMNHSNMLGTGANGSVDPRYMFGGLAATEKILAIETGGHINTLFKDCDFKLGYIGHSSNGSYATTSSPAGSTFDVFKFDGARLNNLCAIYTPPYPVVENLKTCPSNTVDLANALLSTTPAGYTLQWWTTPYRTPGTQVADPTKAGVGTYYAFFVRDVDDCPNVEGIEMKVSYYTSADAAYVDCGCELPPNTQPATDFTLTGISNLVGFANGWPGNVPNGFIAIESKNKGFVITRVANTNAITNPIEGMLIYDISAPCVKLYTVIGPGVTLGWKCLEKLCE